MEQFLTLGEDMDWNESFKIGLSVIDAQHLQIFRYRKELAKYSLVHCKKLAKKCIDEARKKGKRLGIPVILDPGLTNLEDQDLRSINNVLSKIDDAPMETRDIKVKDLIDKCRLPWEFMLIQTNGDIYPCCHSSIVLGNLKNEPWEKIWNGPLARELRKKFMKDILPKECVNQPCGVGKI